MYSHVYLSPHFDDVSLSCGGSVHRQARQEQPVLVITVFAAAPQPEQPLSPFAQAIHQAWGMPGDAVAVRQSEDRAALAILGADYLRLNLEDCIYRGRPEAGEWYYTGEAALFGQVHPADAVLAAEIVEAVTELVPFREDTVLYAPLAVGHHVDHQLTQAAAWQLRQRGWAIAFYEDYPYSDPGYPFTRPANPWESGYTLAATLAGRQGANLQSERRHFSEEDLQAKISSVAAYTSQVATLFGDEAELARLLRRHALNVGEGRPAERIWQPGQPVTGPVPATAYQS